MADDLKSVRSAHNWNHGTLEYWNNGFNGLGSTFDKHRVLSRFLSQHSSIPFFHCSNEKRRGDVTKKKGGLQYIMEFQRRIIIPLPDRPFASWRCLGGSVPCRPEQWPPSVRRIPCLQWKGPCWRSARPQIWWSLAG